MGAPFSLLLTQSVFGALNTRQPSYAMNEAPLLKVSCCNGKSDRPHKDKNLQQLFWWHNFVSTGTDFWQNEHRKRLVMRCSKNRDVWNMEHWNISAGRFSSRFGVLGV